MNVAYEVHFYDSIRVFGRVKSFAEARPVIVGEFGLIPNEYNGISMSMVDCSNLIDKAEEIGIAWVAWSMSSDDPPNMLKEDGGFTVYGNMIKCKLANNKI